MEHGSKILHLICSCLLLVAFLAVSIGSGSLIYGPQDEGANIGGGFIMLLGYAVGAMGLMVGLAALVTYRIASRSR